MLPLLVNEREMEPIVIKNSDRLVSFKFEDFQLLDLLIFLGGARSLEHFFNAYKTSHTKGYFPSDWFNDSEKLNSTKLTPCKTFLSKLGKKFPWLFRLSKFNRWGLEIKRCNFETDIEATTATGQENYQNLTRVWQQENMCTFKDFLR